MSDALDGGLTAAAGEDAARHDLAAQVRVALYEITAGRDDAARARLARVHSGSADVQRSRHALELLLDVHAGRVTTRSAGHAHDSIDLSVPPPGDDATPAVLSQLAVLGYARLVADAPAGCTWAEHEALADRVAAATEEWLRSTTTKSGFLLGVGAAVHACSFGCHAGRSRWSAHTFARLRRRAERFRLRAWLATMATFEAYCWVLQGDLERAAPLLAEALPALEAESTSPLLPLAQGLRRFAVALGAPAPQGDLPTDADVDPKRLTRATARHALIFSHATTAVISGDLAAAGRLLAEAGQLTDLVLVHEDRTRVHLIAVAAAVAAGDRRAARQIRDATAALMASPTRTANLLAMDALIDSAAGIVGQAPDSGSEIEPLLARWSVLAITAASGERDTALTALSALEEILAELQAEALRARAVQLFREGAVTPASRLTARQAEVATLAAGGLSNREIATRLFLSVRTVEHYVGEALHALGLNRRGQLLDVLLPVAPGSRGPHRGPALTIRQGQVAVLVAADCSNAQIATILGVSVKAVEKHVAAVKAAIGATSRVHIKAAFLSPSGSTVQDRTAQPSVEHEAPRHDDTSTAADR